jgi:tetratricopeptide (TPR) repeat protein
LELPKVPWDQRLGNVAEDNVQARLSCFSNPTKIQTDVGIDFSCELLERDQPSISFYVQVKGTEGFDDNWGRSIEKSTVRYWLTRFFPVYLIVYDAKNRACYWKSIEDIRYWLLDKMGSESETIYIQMDRAHILEEGKDRNEEFIRKVKDDFLLVQMWLGHAYLRGEGWVKIMPHSPRADIELARIKESTRINLYVLVTHSFEVGDIQGAYAYLEFLTKLDKSHFNHFQWFGIVNQLLGNKDAARTAFSEALAICERDKTWPIESMEPIKELIRKQRENV